MRLALLIRNFLFSLVLFPSEHAIQQHHVQTELVVGAMVSVDIRQPSVVQDALSTVMRKLRVGSTVRLDHKHVL